jgi:hypothetical protein
MKGSAHTWSDPNAWLPTVAQNVSAAGTTLGTATQIPVGQDFTVITTCASSAGVNLPARGVSVGEEYVVANHGANACAVYPGSSTGTMGTAAAGTAYSVAADKTGFFTNIGPGIWTVCP